MRSRDVESATVCEEPASKRSRISSIAVNKSVSSSVSTKQQKKLEKPKKIWQNQGLYVGQEPDFDARLTESKNKKKQQQMTTQSSHDKKVNSLLPPPMFRGQRLLEQGRPFKLPYDVYSPLPAGQPRPEGMEKD